MGRTIPAAGDDDIKTLPLGLAGQMGYVLRTLRKLKVKGHLSLDQLLPEQRENLPAFSSTGVGVNDDHNLSGNFFQRRGPPLANESCVFSSYQISQHFTRFFNLKKKRGYVTVFKGGQGVEGTREGVEKDQRLILESLTLESLNPSFGSP
jgi:hypothetical protein